MKRVRKIVKLINKLALLGATLTSLLYMLYITATSIILYLYNRPIRTCFLCLAFGVIMMALDTIEDNKKKQAQARINGRKQATRQVTRQAQAR